MMMMMVMMMMVMMMMVMVIPKLIHDFLLSMMVLASATMAFFIRDCLLLVSIDMLQHASIRTFEDNLVMMMTVMMMVMLMVIMTIPDTITHVRYSRVRLIGISSS